MVGDEGLAILTAASVDPNPPSPLVVASRLSTIFNEIYSLHETVACFDCEVLPSNVVYGSQKLPAVPRVDEADTVGESEGRFAYAGAGEYEP